MPVINRIADFADDMKTWRRHLHRHPELGFELYQTAAFVEERLREFGVDEIHTGIAKTGIVAVINGQGDGPTVGLRADMDALPIHEETGADHASAHEGVMHACGHDGHTTMLLGAARYLAETRRFSGRVALIFQPAEESGGGGGVMVDEGIMERFDIAEVYALHTLPGEALGSFHTCPGRIMAAVDDFEIHLTGRGGHAAHPDDCIDPIPAAMGMIGAMQNIVTRNKNPFDEMVLSITQVHAGSASNIIPETAYINGTVRCFSEGVRDMAETRIREIVAGQAAAYGVEARIVYDRWYPATVNDAEKTELAASVAREVAGADNVNTEAEPTMGAEDFAYLLNARPGAYLFLGQGAGAGLHHPAFDFNDEVAPVGASFFARLVETVQPLG